MHSSELFSWQTRNIGQDGGFAQHSAVVEMKAHKRYIAYAPHN